MVKKLAAQLYVYYVSDSIIVSIIARNSVLLERSLSKQNGMGLQNPMYLKQGQYYIICKLTKSGFTRNWKLAISITDSLGLN